MKYYVTSHNVRNLAVIIDDYEKLKYSVHPQEYAFNYMTIEYTSKLEDNLKKTDESLTELQDIKVYEPTTAEENLEWMKTTLIGYFKYEKMLKFICKDYGRSLSEIEHIYSKIILYSIIFDLPPNADSLLFKCMSELSCILVTTFTQYFKREKVISALTMYCCKYYDPRFAMEKIITPLQAWKPALNELLHKIKEFLEQLHSREVKSPTKPKTPEVLKRQSKYIPREDSAFIPSNYDDFEPKNQKMLTKEKIDEQLAVAFAINRENAQLLYNKIINFSPHFAKNKSMKYYNTIKRIEKENEKKYEYINQASDVPEFPEADIKPTVAHIKRLGAKAKEIEDAELGWFDNILKSCTNTEKYKNLEEHIRQEDERARLEDVERKRVLCQLSREEAIIAKKKIVAENKERYVKIQEEKKEWEIIVNQIKNDYALKIKQHISNAAIFELSKLTALGKVAAAKKKKAERVKNFELINKNKIKEEKEIELNKKINLIKQMRAISLIAREARLSKVIDLTESSKLGFLYEMSIAELKERLALLTIEIKEELRKKHDMVNTIRSQYKQKYQQELQTVNEFLEERKRIAQIEKQRKKREKLKKECASKIETNANQELKKLLETKRRERIELCEKF